MEENEKLYKFGVNGYDWLKIRGNSYIDSSLLFWGAYRIIECDINDKSMKVRFCNWKEENWKEMDMSELQRNGVIDIDENGSHWEGDCMKGVPYGYGKLFNEENVLIYKGFMYKVEKICYGEEYYEKNSSLQYQGTYYNNKRSGYGILYDKNLYYKMKDSKDYTSVDNALVIDNQFHDVALLQEIFNHSSPSITLKYIGVNQQRIDESYYNFSL